MEAGGWVGRRAWVAHGLSRGPLGRLGVGHGGRGRQRRAAAVPGFYHAGACVVGRVGGPGDGQRAVVVWRDVGCWTTARSPLLITTGSVSGAVAVAVADRIKGAVSVRAWAAAAGRRGRRRCLSSEQRRRPLALRVRVVLPVLVVAVVVGVVVGVAVVWPLALSVKLLLAGRMSMSVQLDGTRVQMMLRARRGRLVGGLSHTGHLIRFFLWSQIPDQRKRPGEGRDPAQCWPGRDACVD